MRYYLREPSEGERKSFYLTAHAKEQLISEIVLKLSLLDSKKLKQHAPIISEIIELD